MRRRCCVNGADPRWLIATDSFSLLSTCCQDDTPVPATAACRFAVTQTLLSGFYFNNSGTASRSDYSMYSVIAYLALFRLSEMGFERFRFVLGGQEAHKMTGLLQWMFNLEVIQTWCVQDWCKAVDRAFVEVRCASLAV